MDEKGTIRPAPDRLLTDTAPPLTPYGEAMTSVNKEAARFSSRFALLERAHRLEQEAAGLRRLAGILPGEMPHEADEALLKLAIRS